jgi:hypothetical protein
MKPDGTRPHVGVLTGNLTSTLTQPSGRILTVQSPTPARPPTRSWLVVSGGTASYSTLASMGIAHTTRASCTCGLPQ